MPSMPYQVRINLTDDPDGYRAEWMGFAASGEDPFECIDRMMTLARVAGVRLDAAVASMKLHQGAQLDILGPGVKDVEEAR